MLCRVNHHLRNAKSPVRARAPERHAHPPAVDPRVRVRPGLQPTAVSPFTPWPIHMHLILDDVKLKELEIAVVLQVVLQVVCRPI